MSNTTLNTNRLVELACGTPAAGLKETCELANEVLQLRVRNLTQAETITDYQKHHASINQNAADWEATAHQYARNTDYYRNIVEDIGNMDLFAFRTHLTDAGEPVPDVLCVKVVESVKDGIDNLCRQRDHAYRERQEALEDATRFKEQSAKETTRANYWRSVANGIARERDDLRKALESSRQQIESITVDRREILDIQLEELRALYDFRGHTLAQVQARLKWLDAGYNLEGLTNWMKDAANRGLEPVFAFSLTDTIDEILLNPEGELAREVQTFIDADTP